MQFVPLIGHTPVLLRSVSLWVQRWNKTFSAGRLVVYYHIQTHFLWSALSSDVSLAHLYPLLWCIYCRHSSPPPPPFILHSRTMKALFVSCKTDPGLLCSSSQPCSAPVKDRNLCLEYWWPEQYMAHAAIFYQSPASYCIYSSHHAFQGWAWK